MGLWLAARRQGTNPNRCSLSTLEDRRRDFFGFMEKWTGNYSHTAA